MRTIGSVLLKQPGRNKTFNKYNLAEVMKKLIEKLEWFNDYYLVYFLYNPNKMDRYYKYMEDRWQM